MQPGFGPGLESPTVASTRTRIVTTVAATAANTMVRSLLVNLRRGVLTRFQCPSRGIRARVTPHTPSGIRHGGEIAGAIFGLLYVVDLHRPAAVFSGQRAGRLRRSVRLKPSTVPSTERKTRGYGFALVESRRYVLAAHRGHA